MSGSYQHIRIERQAADEPGRPRPAINDRVIVVDASGDLVDISNIVKRWNIDGTMGQAHLLTLELISFEVR